MSSEQMVPAADIAERALAGAGPGGRVALVRETVEAEVRFANNTVTTNGLRRDRHISVISFAARPDGVAAGVASGSGALRLEDLVSASETDARSSPAADDAFELVAGGGGDGSGGTGSGGTGFSDDPEATSLATLRPVIDPLGDMFGRAESAGLVMAGFATHRMTTSYLASTTGLRRRFVQPEGSVELVGRSTDGTRSAWAGAGTHRFDDIELATLEGRIVRGLSWAERRVELPPGRYEALLPGDAVADLVIMLDAGLSGREAEEGRTALSRPGGGTKVGERLSGEGFGLWSDPFAVGLESAPFVLTTASTVDESVFDNGLATTRTDWIAGGLLQRLRYHRAGAARSGTEFAPESGNIVLDLPGASADLEELVAHTERGLLLTSLWYIREVDPATMLYTGLTRDGVYLVENGEVSAAVNNFRFNESPIDMLDRCIEAGASRRSFSREWGSWVTRTSMPPIRVADFNMSSVSPAT